MKAKEVKKTKVAKTPVASRKSSTKSGTAKPANKVARVDNRPKVSEVKALRAELASTEEQRDGWRNTAKRAEWDLAQTKTDLSLSNNRAQNYRDTHTAHNLLTLGLAVIAVVAVAGWIFK